MTPCCRHHSLTERPLLRHYWICAAHSCSSARCFNSALVILTPHNTTVAKPFATFRYYCLMCVYARLGLTVTLQEVTPLSASCNMNYLSYPEKQLAKWAAIRYTANHIFSYIELDEQHAIIEVAVPEDWQGRSIGELDIRRKCGVNILGVKRNGKTDVNISPETMLDADMTLLVLGENQELKKHFRL